MSKEIVQIKLKLQKDKKLLESVRRTLPLKITTRNYGTERAYQLGYYLAGLIESDGWITVTKNIQIGITFNSKDLPLALKIKETLKGGFIVSKRPF